MSTTLLDGILEEDISISVIASILRLASYEVSNECETSCDVVIEGMAIQVLMLVNQKMISYRVNGKLPKDIDFLKATIGANNCNNRFPALRFSTAIFEERVILVSECNFSYCKGIVTHHIPFNVLFFKRGVSTGWAYLFESTATY